MLTLFARARILASERRVDAELASRMTSNHFLSAFGEPTAVEAQLGRVYLEHGLERAFAWIEAEWMPLFRRQEQKRFRGVASSRTENDAARGVTGARRPALRADRE